MRIFWIIELGTALPHGYNENVGNLSSSACSDLNVMILFNTKL